MQRNDEGIVNKVFSETGDAASPAFYEQGFTPAMSTPGSGVFPPRTAFNFLFKVLTALAVDINSCGCLLPWDPLVNYYKGARVTASNDKIYIAMVATGPASFNSKDPAAFQPNPAIWQISPEYSLGTMAQQNANAVAVTGGTINGTNINTIIAALGTLANQNANGVALTGGTMDGVTIGATNPGAAVFTKAVDNGVAPTLAAQLTNKSYVDGTLTPGTFNGQDSLYVKLPGGLVMQVFYGAYSGNSSGEVSSFPQSFPNKCIRVLGNDTTGNRTIGTSVNPSNSASEFLAFTNSITVDANIIAIGY